MIVVGKPAPKLELPGDDGRLFKLIDHRGSPVVLYFYPKDDTSGCTLEAQEFTALMPDFRNSGAVVAGVSPDTVASHCKFRDKFSLGVLLLADDDQSVCNTYGVWVEKSMYGRKYMGVERTTVLIDPKGRITKIWNKVKALGHAAEVLAAVLGLKTGKA